MKLRTLVALTVALVLAAPFGGCNTSPKDGGEDCSANDECMTGCCEAEFETCTYPGDSGVSCMSGSGSSTVCCQYQEKDSFISADGSVYGDWEPRCDCIYSSCSEVQSNTECDEYGCDETLVQGVTEVSSCS
jgi:hypothetical protein